MNYFYCEYCGDKFSSIESLTSKSCAKHPNGFHKGKHKQSYYFCKYCGTPNYLQTTLKLCPKNIRGRNHKPYKGNKESYYICKSCDCLSFCLLYLLDLYSHCHKHKK